MKKRVILFSMFILLLIGIVFAAHNTTLSVNPISSYETVKTNFTLSLTNDGPDTIKNVTLTIANYTIDSVDSSVPAIINGNSITWYGLSIFSGWPGFFKFNATSIQTNSNITNSWRIDSLDVNNIVNTNGVSVTSLNDSNIPIITSIVPLDYSFVKNDSLINFVVNVNESETNVDYSSPFLLNFRDDTIVDIFSSTSKSIILNKLADNQFSGNLDVNNISNMNLVAGSVFLNYKLNGLKDSVGNEYAENNNTHHLFVDTQKPGLLINSHKSPIITNQYLQNVTFNVSDDSFLANGQGLFAPNLTCSIKIDNYFNNSRVYLISTNNTGLEVNLTGLQDDVHSWLISCLDKTGDFSYSTNNITLDTKGPDIALVYPSQGGITIANTTIMSISIKDVFSGVNTVLGYTQMYNISLINDSTSNFNINTSNWTDGLNLITIFANDSLGNSNNLIINFTLDILNPPTIYLNSPANSALNNEWINFSYNISDNYSPTSICYLNIRDVFNSVVYNNSTTVNNGTINTVLINLQNGTYTWDVLCSDQGNNRNQSETRTLNVDTIAPVITLLEPQNNANDDDGAISFNYSSLDANGIANCSLYINNVFVKNTSSILAFPENISYSLAANNTVYNWNVSCYDTLGNLGSSNILRKVYYDNIVPNIFNVTYTKTDSSATITWNVNEDANETLEYWIYPNTTISTNTSFSSSTNLRLKTINGLSASTIYYFNIIATDFFNNTNKSITYSFTTDAAPSSPSGGGGGGGGGGSCDPEWQIGSWSKCSSNGIQTRTVTDLNNCRENENKPITEQLCIYLECKIDSDCDLGYECKSNKCEKKEVPTTPAEGNGIGSGDGITGFAILDNIKANPKIAAILAVLILGIMLGSYYWLKSGDIPKDKVKEVISEGRINQE